MAIRGALRAIIGLAIAPCPRICSSLVIHLFLLRGVLWCCGVYVYGDSLLKCTAAGRDKNEIHGVGQQATMAAGTPVNRIPPACVRQCHSQKSLGATSTAHCSPSYRIQTSTKTGLTIQTEMSTYSRTSIRASLLRPRESLRHIPSATDASIVDITMFTFLRYDTALLGSVCVKRGRRDKARSF